MLRSRGTGLAQRASRALSGVPYGKLSVGVPKETAHLEKRVAQTPETVGGLVKEGFTVRVEKGAGEAASFPDAAYEAAGAKITDAAGAYGCSIITKVAVPSAEEARMVGDKAKEMPFDVEFIGLPGEEIPLDENSVDTVLVTYSLCTIPDPVAALKGMARVLRPGGKLVFCEHGEAPDEGVRRWQARVNPLWSKLAGGCNLNRPIPSLLGQGGFELEGLEQMYLPSTPRIAGYNYWGSAAPG